MPLGNEPHWIKKKSIQIRIKFPHHSTTGIIGAKFLGHHIFLRLAELSAAYIHLLRGQPPDDPMITVEIRWRSEDPAFRKEKQKRGYSNEQRWNPYDIPFYRFVHRDPCNGFYNPYRTIELGSIIPILQQITRVSGHCSNVLKLRVIHPKKTTI